MERLRKSVVRWWNSNWHLSLILPALVCVTTKQVTGMIQRPSLGNQGLEIPTICFLNHHPEDTITLVEIESAGWCRTKQIIRHMIVYVGEGGGMKVLSTFQPVQNYTLAKMSE